MSSKFIISSILLALSVCQIAVAEKKAPISTDEPILVLEKVIVTGKNTGVKLLDQHDITPEEIGSKQAQVSDTAKLLEDVSGLSFQSNGGVTSLPIIHGLNDDRIKIEIDGMVIPAACPNHMNPSLSYIDPSNVAKISVLKGVSPVSMGGDSIAGTISVQSAAPVFAEPGKGILINGRASSFYRSNGDAYGGSIAAGIANQNVRLDYTGSTSQARNYHDGNDEIIRSSNYTNQNHAAGLAFNFDNHLFEIKGGQEHVPFQAYPNARMQMTANDGIFGNAHYRGIFDWGNVDGRLFMENTDHEMEVGPDQLMPNKRPPPADTAIMPMITQTRNFGYKLQAEWLLSQQDIVKIGNEFHSQRLNDFWPPSCSDPDCGDMGPGTFMNVNNGTRDRLGTFAEWEANWSPAWKSLLGLRYDHSMTDADNVYGYNTTNSAYGNDVKLFNAQNHQRNFDTFDITALMKFTPNNRSQYEFGYARKNRAPSIYEMYIWSHAAMQMTMIGWFGDGNAYVGNLQLKPETAHNLSFTAEYYDPKSDAWSIKVTPYFSYVENFIDADRDKCPPKSTCGRQPKNNFSYLRMANHDARLYGVDVSGNAKLFEDETLGQFATHSIMSYVRGERMDGGNLYHMMPFNLKLGLDHKLEGWKNALEMQYVDAKQDVQAIRNETHTPSYILLNAKTGYQWKKVSIDVGVDNLLDKQYYSPLGGAYTGNYYAMTLNAVPANMKNTPLPGMGRSVYVGMTITY